MRFRSRVLNQPAKSVIHARLAAALLALVPALGPTNHAFGQTGVNPVAEETWAALGRRGGDALVVRRLTLLGSTAAPFYLELAIGRRSLPSEVRAARPDALARIWDGFCALPPAAVDRALADVLEGDLELGELLDLCRWLQAGAVNGCGERLVALHASLDPGQRSRPHVSVELRRAFVQQITAREEAARRIAARAVGLPLDTQEWLAVAAGDLRGNTALILLEPLLSGADPVRARALATLGQVDMRDWHRTGADRVSLARRGLDAPEPALRALAVQALGRLPAEPVVVELIALLEDSRADVRDSALDALRALSGHVGGADAREWSQLYQAERLWRAEAGAELRSVIASGPSPESRRAIEEVAKHSFGMAERAEWIALGLQHDDPAVASRAVRLLGPLAPASLPYLIQATAHPNARVAGLAHKRLTVLTRVRREPNVEAWNDWLNS